MNKLICIIFLSLISNCVIEQESFRSVAPRCCERSDGSIDVCFDTITHNGDVILTHNVIPPSTLISNNISNSEAFLIENDICDSRNAFVVIF